MPICKQKIVSEFKGQWASWMKALTALDLFLLQKFPAWKMLNEALSNLLEKYQQKLQNAQESVM